MRSTKTLGFTRHRASHVSRCIRRGSSRTCLIASRLNGQMMEGRRSAEGGEERGLDGVTLLVFNTNWTAVTREWIHVVCCVSFKAFWVNQSLFQPRLLFPYKITALKVSSCTLAPKNIKASEKGVINWKHLSWYHKQNVHRQIWVNSIIHETGLSGCWDAYFNCCASLTVIYKCLKEEQGEVIVVHASVAFCWNIFSNLGCFSIVLA